MRRCYEMEVTEKDMTAVLTGSVPLRQYTKGEPAYNACCELLYTRYHENHKAINPLTADYETFCQQIPETVYCQDMHFAFIEGNEIAYVGSMDESGFIEFAQNLVTVLFKKYEEIFFECDDSDNAAMALRSLFVTENDVSFDTYIF